MLSTRTLAAPAPQALPRFKILKEPVRRAEMRAALDAGQFVAVFQPCVQPRTGRVVSLEATIRWQHPRRGLLLPHDFICEADQYGLLTDIFVSLAGQAGQAAKTWQGVPDLAVPLTLNLSGALLRTPAAAAALQHGIDASGLGPRDILIAASGGEAGRRRIDLHGCDDTRKALTALLLAQGSPAGLALDHVSTLLQWLIAVDMNVGLVQGDFVCPPLPRGQLARAVQHWNATFAVISAANAAL